MEQRIDKIIKKAQIIREYLSTENKEMGNVDGLIKSLESYRDNIGDISQERLFTFRCLGKDIMDDLPYISINDEPYHRLTNCLCENILGIRLISFTLHIYDVISKTRHSTDILTFPNIIELDNNIADAVFDIQSYPIKDNTVLMTKLIEGGFKPTTTDIKYVCDFETSMMTLDEAIQHCKEKSCGDSECANEHRQLAEWLQELKYLRAQQKE